MNANRPVKADRADAGFAWDGEVMEGESNDQPGYMVRGQIFAVGYMQGLIASVKAERGTQPIDSP